MASFISSENAFNPRNYLVRGGICRLVKIEKSGRDIVADLPFKRRATLRQRRIVVSTNVQLIVVLEIIYKRQEKYTPSKEEAIPTRQVLSQHSKTALGNYQWSGLLPNRPWNVYPSCP